MVDDGAQQSLELVKALYKTKLSNGKQIDAVSFSPCTAMVSNTDVIKSASSEKHLLTSSNSKSKTEGKAQSLLAMSRWFTTSMDMVGCSRIERTRIGEVDVGLLSNRV